MQCVVSATYWGWDNGIDALVDAINPNYDDYVWTTSSREWNWILDQQAANKLVKKLSLIKLHDVRVRALTPSQSA